MKPPSIILKQIFPDAHVQIINHFAEKAAKEVSLSTDETKIWIKPLATDVEKRRRGATKAATQQKQPELVCSQDVQPSITTQIDSWKQQSKQRELKKPVSRSQSEIMNQIISVVHTESCTAMA